MTIIEQIIEILQLWLVEKHPFRSLWIPVF